LDRLQLTRDEAQQLLRSQFPKWANLPVVEMGSPGWDNCSFRLGDRLVLRFPSAPCYAGQVEKEQRWLPFLAPRLPFAIPVPQGLGAPEGRYPFPWSIHSWLPGEPVQDAHSIDRSRLAQDLVHFLRALHSIDPGGGPPAGPENFHRGGSLSIYDQQSRLALTRLKGSIDTDRALQIWQKATSSLFSGPLVWVHGDLAASNLVVENGLLTGILDFGQLAVGDPACDLACAWTLFLAEDRRLFQKELNVEEGTWNRARGWALWKALIVAAELSGSLLWSPTDALQLAQQILVEDEETS
jgi:aminoglycoside phosphotransferase (APT) family kinase protein